MTYAEHGAQADAEIAALKARLAIWEGGNSAKSKLFAVWHNTWKSPPIRALPAPVRDRIGQISLGIAQSTGGGAVGYYSGNGQSDADHAADIRAFVADGKHVLLGVGGAGDKTTLTSDAHVTAFIASVRALQRKFGFTGIDFDLEPSGSSWSVEHGAKALLQLRRDGYRIVITPGLYSPHTVKWGQLVAALGMTGYDYLAPMLYDFPEATDSRLNRVSLQKVEHCRAIGVPVEKILLGYMLQPFAGYPASPPHVLDAAWKTAVKAYPTLPGLFLWETSIDASQSWVVSNGTGKTVAGR